MKHDEIQRRIKETNRLFCIFFERHLNPSLKLIRDFKRMDIKEKRRYLGLTEPDGSEVQICSANVLRKTRPTIVLYYR